jgi:hypothetical protein
MLCRPRFRICHGISVLGMIRSIDSTATVSLWTFTMAHVSLEDVLPLVQTHMAVSRLPYQERLEALQVLSIPHFPTPSHMFLHFPIPPHTIPHLVTLCYAIPRHDASIYTIPAFCPLCMNFHVLPRLFTPPHTILHPPTAIHAILTFLSLFTQIFFCVCVCVCVCVCLVVGGGGGGWGAGGN